jgi:5-methylcytosine-specific restriction endonuclease McrA
MAKKTGKLISCKNCNKDFWVEPNQQKSGKYLCCSRVCANVQKREGKLISCFVCGKKVYRRPAFMKSAKRIFCSRACHGVYKINSSNHTSKANSIVRRSFEYREWRKAVLQRDNYTCQECGIRQWPLQADHIKPFALYVKLRFNIDNGRTLCKSCHLKTPTWGRRAMAA